MIRKTISCLIPVYNEGPRLAEVLRVVSEYPGFNEVIVIDDASTDDTAAVATQFPVQVVRHPKNRGKAAAIYSGYLRTKSHFICLIDGDLTKVTAEHLSKLIEPIYSEDCMAIALLENAWPIFRVTGLDPWSGERVFPRSVLDEIYENSKVLDQKYIIESKINQTVIRQRLPIYSVGWSDVENIPKSKKHRHLLAGLIQELKMYFEIYSSFGLFKTLHQQISMPLIVKKRG